MAHTDAKLNERAERRAMLALVAVFVLFVQAIIPTFAAAAPRGQAK